MLQTFFAQVFENQEWSVIFRAVTQEFNQVGMKNLS